MTRDPVLGLFKFGRRQHIEDLVLSGHLYMNTLAYFSRHEADSLRCDRDEGIGHCFQADVAELRTEIDGQWATVGTISGAVRWSDNTTRAANVFCMYAFRGSHAEGLIDPRNLAFGDTYVIFTQGDEFLRRVRSVADEAGLRLVDGLVEYVDRHTYSGPMGIFRKFSEFAYQSEFRIALLPGTGIPYSLRVGDLSDIALVGESSKFNEQIQVVLRNTE